jgi:hypothetical protein
MSSKSKNKENWKVLVKETKQLIGKYFEDEKDRKFKFIGLVYVSTGDYYYGMSNPVSGLKLYSCMSNLTEYGFTQIVQTRENNE